MWIPSRQTLAPGDALLLGTDLVKPTAQLLDAYDDPTGVTAAFNLNLLGRINRELQGDFDLRQFAHVIRYHEEAQRIEMHLRSRVYQIVSIRKADLIVDFAAGETICTEACHKFYPGAGGNHGDGRRVPAGTAVGGRRVGLRGEPAGVPVGRLAALSQTYHYRSISRVGGLVSGFSLARLKSSSNFFSSTLPCDLLGLELLLKELLAAVARALELGHFGGEIVDQRRLHRNRVSNYCARLRIDLQNRIAAGACHLEHRLGHSSIVIEIGAGLRCRHLPGTLS